MPLVPQNGAIVGLWAFHICCPTFSTLVDLPSKGIAYPLKSLQLFMVLPIIYSNPIYLVDFNLQIFSLPTTTY